MSFGRSEVTAGAIISYGDSTTGRVFRPIEVETDNAVQVDYFRLSFLIGFKFSFN